MTTLSKSIACLVATFAIAALAWAEEKHQLKVVLQVSPEAGLIELETDDMAIGESRSLTSEKGLPVLLTRTDKGFEVEVAGKKTQIDLPAPGGEGFEYEIHQGAEAGESGGETIEKHVIVKRIGSDANVTVKDSQGARIEIHGPESGAHKEVRVIRVGGDGATAGEPRQIQVMMHGDGDFAAARAKLLASGALDGLDEATRAKILAALGGQDQ